MRFLTRYLQQLDERRCRLSHSKRTSCLSIYWHQQCCKFQEVVKLKFRSWIEGKWVCCSRKNYRIQPAQLLSCYCFRVSVIDLLAYILISVKKHDFWLKILDVGNINFFKLSFCRANSRLILFIDGREKWMQPQQGASPELSASRSIYAAERMIQTTEAAITNIHPIKINWSQQCGRTVIPHNKQRVCLEGQRSTL